MGCCSRESLGKPRMLPQHSHDLFAAVVLPAATVSQAGTLPLQTAQLLLHEQNQHGQCDLQHVQGSLEMLFQLPGWNATKSILGVRVFQSPHSRCGQMWWLITCTSQASAGNHPEGIQPAQLPGTTSHLKVLHLFFQPSYSFLFPLYNWGETQTWKQGTATCSSPPKNKLFSIQDGCKKRHHTPRTAWERPLGWS